MSGGCRPLAPPHCPWSHIRGHPASPAALSTPFPRAPHLAHEPLGFEAHAGSPQGTGLALLQRAWKSFVLHFPACTQLRAGSCAHLLFPTPRDTRVRGEHPEPSGHSSFTCPLGHATLSPRQAAVGQSWGWGRGTMPTLCPPASLPERSLGIIGALGV